MQKQQQQPMVLAYCRFSSARQAKGNSLERQEQNAQAWCDKRGWKLFDSLNDLGLSAWTGANKKRGRLGELLEKLEAGDIVPGTYLLVEALDRLTREEITNAVSLITRLLDAGLVIVTLTDGKEWTKEGMNAHNIDFLMSVLLLSRGYEESLQKASRLRDTFENARKKQSRKEFGSAPGWLRREDKTDDWSVIEDRAISVQKVFELAALGYGSKAISKVANAEKWPIPTRDTKDKPDIWHGTMPGRLLRMRAVLGEHEYRIMTHAAKKEVKHWQGKRSGIIVEDYYPQIVSDDLWHRARASIETRMTNTRRRDENYFNIWSGLLRCGHCGAMIQRKQESRGGSKAQLICSNKIAGITDCPTGGASKTDYELLSSICSVSGAQMGLGYNKEKLAREVDIARSRLVDLSKGAAGLAEAIAATGGQLPELIRKANELAAEKAKLELEIAGHQAMLANEPNSMLDTSYADKVRAHLYERSAESMQIRAEANSRLRRAVREIWHFAYDVALVDYLDNRRQLVSLGSKTKVERHRPYFALAQAGELFPPLAPV